jgi:2-hydroxychromene-2-carboxylate isomerase
MAEVIFYFDFGSPNAYLAHRVLPEILARTGATMRVVPCLLGGLFKATGNSAPMVQFAGVPAKLAYERREMQRFITKHGLTKFRSNPHFPVNTLLLMRGAVAAQLDGFLDRYIEIGLVAMWDEGLNMSDPEVYAAAFDRGGLNGKVLLLRTQEQTVKDGLIANTEAAVAHGAFGIPSFLVGDELFFGKDRLGQVEVALGGYYGPRSTAPP